MATTQSDDARTPKTVEATTPAPAQSSNSPEQGGSEAPSRSAPKSEDGETSSNARVGTASPTNPPLPDEEAPPLPDEAPPQDDGWDAIWDWHAQAYYFYNRITNVTQWENPRVPEAQAAAASYGSYDRYAQGAAPGTMSSSGAPGTSSPPKRLAGGYNPAIHGSYDPNADYAKVAEEEEEDGEGMAASAFHALGVGVGATGLTDRTQDYAATGTFNRFTGRFQSAAINPELHNDENKSRRQMGAFFDVDAAANSHDGRSLKAERRNKNISKKELKAFKEKRREKKEEKRRAWLRD